MNIQARYFISLALLFFIYINLYSQTEKEKNLENYFKKYNVSGCFVLYDQSNDLTIRYNPEKCDKQYTPASTFKIPNAVIALEEKVIKDEFEIIKWDSTKQPVKEWNQDQNLQTAMKYSCVWFFSELAKKISNKKYQQYINQFNYGNKDITGQPYRFWLAGLLRISANQQIEFLKQLYNYQLGVSNRSIDITKNVILLENNENYKFYGKTGSGLIPDNRHIMWLVGFVESNNNVYYYAMNFECDDLNETVRSARNEITKEILKELNVLE